MDWLEIDKIIKSNLINNFELDVIRISDFRKTKGRYFGVTTEENSDELLVSPRIKITISYITEKDEIQGIKIERFQFKKNIWEKDQELNLSNAGREKIVSLLNLILALDMKGVTKRYITLDAELAKIDKNTKNKIKTLLITPDGQKLLKEISQSEISNEDIVSISYRKKQLKIFKAMLSNADFIDKYKKAFKINKEGEEIAWQHFFERNPWILGYGLNYIFCGNISDKKLENVICGADFNEGGKRTDALLKTHGNISSFVLVEIKTPRTPLVDGMKRSESWSISKCAIDGIAQSHKSEMKFKKKYYEKCGIKNKQGDPTGEFIFNFTPKSYLLIGNLKEFVTESGINEDKYSSFELFRSNCFKPEIITYDELYERAKMILSQEEKKET